MEFLSLLGKRLKDDDVIEVLEHLDIEVVYAFDRLHENTPDVYWAASKNEGFQLRFDENQILDVIFLYIISHEGFTATDPDECDVELFSTSEEANSFAIQKRSQATEGSTNSFGIQRHWLRLEFISYSIH